MSDNALSLRNDGITPATSYVALVALVEALAARIEVLERQLADPAYEQARMQAIEQRMTNAEYVQTYGRGFAGDE